ncbi:amidase [Haloglycomyces albus]|uniref:amidase n=1 Tax=Haloglycomyces albus TaxID=526067 RepID=UPI00046CBAF5|nr:amidase [Haloglycomyces albus]
MTDPFIRTIHSTESDSHATGPLAGLRLAVKDLYDIAGIPTGAGNPRWLETHDIPTSDATAVARLKDAGATVVGKTITDELAWSLNGTNFHYGTPTNPAAPGRVPGGSSSGSASAVALEAADIALGTDTGGSVRVPASYCGLYGLRPTHGRIPMDGVVPLAPSLDTAGLFARDASTLRTAMDVLYQSANPTSPITTLIAPADIWDSVDPAVREALYPAIEGFGLEIDRTPLLDDIAELETARQTYATILAWEAWQQHGTWIEQARPEFGPGVGARFANAAKLTQDDVTPAEQHRERITTLIREHLTDGAVLAIPAAPGPAPKPDAPFDREALVRMTCLSGLSGAPAISLPLGRVDGLPVNLQVIAAHDTDESLLKLAEQS